MVIESRDRHTVSNDYDMAIHVAYELPAGLRGPNGERELVMLALHAKQGTMLPEGRRVQPGDVLARCGRFKNMGHPHFHTQFFWSRADSHAYRHAKAVDPFFIRRDYLPEEMPIKRVSNAAGRWWKERPGVRPRPDEVGMAEVSLYPEAEAEEYGETVCAVGEPLPEWRDG